MIFQVLEHLNDFEIIGYGGHFVFQNKAKIFLTKHLQARTFHGLSLHSKTIVPKKTGQGLLLTARKQQLCGHPVDIKLLNLTSIKIT